MPRGIDYALDTVFEILKALRVFEEAGKDASTYELANFVKRDVSVFLRYRRVLEKHGLIEVIPKGNQNIIRLTERGRCMASCL